MHCLIVFPFFLKNLTMQNIWSVVDLLRRNPHWWSPVNRYNDRLLSLLSFSFFQVELVCLWILELIVLPPALISSAGIWSVPGDLWLFICSIVVSSSKALGLDTSALLYVFKSIWQCIPYSFYEMSLKKTRIEFVIFVGGQDIVVSLD
jgi:hypothetical protein